MWKTIDKMRKESDSVKRGIAFMTSFAVTGFLLVSWVVFRSPGDNPELKKDADELISPLEALSQSVVAGVGEISNNLAGTKEILSGITEGIASSTATSTETSTVETGDIAGGKENTSTSTSATDEDVGASAEKQSVEDESMNRNRI